MAIGVFFIIVMAVCLVIHGHNKWKAWIKNRAR